MSTQGLALLLLALAVCTALSATAGLIGYNIAREGGLPVFKAIGCGSFVFFCVMTLCLALLAVLVTAVT